MYSVQFTMVCNGEFSIWGHSESLLTCKNWTTVYSVQCTVYSVQCTVYSVQCTVQCTVYSAKCTVYSVPLHLLGLLLQSTTTVPGLSSPRGRPFWNWQGTARITTRPCSYSTVCSLINTLDCQYSWNTI